jgi:GNAT superfamily N-acetyltransferase
MRSARRYVHARDSEAVRRLCEGVYGGEDYLPNRLAAFAGDARCCPVVLEVTGPGGAREVAAFANLRAMVEKSSASSTPLFLEAVRVLPRAYGNGYGGAVVREAIKIARRAFWRDGQPPPPPPIVSVTIEANAAMMRLFSSLGFEACGGGKLHIWPGYSAFHAAGASDAPGTPLLDVLGVARHIPASARALMDSWAPIPSRGELRAALESLGAQARRASDGAPAPTGFVPKYYALAAAESFTCEAGGDATAWRLLDGSALLVVHEEPNVTARAHRTIVSVCALSAAGAEAAVTFADRRLCLTRFRAVFDTSVAAQDLAASPLLGPVAPTPFEAFVLRASLL